MAKLTGVTIENSSILRLNQEAHIGDYIDLNDLKTVDTSNIEKQIKDNTDEVYRVSLSKEKEKWILERDKEISANSLKDKETFDKEKEELNKKINDLTNQLSLIGSQNEVERTKSESEYNQKILSLNNEISRLNSLQEQIKKDASYEAEKHNSDTISNLRQEIAALKSDKDKELIKKDNERLSEMTNLKEVSSKVENDLKDKIRELDNQLNNIKLEKAATGVKVLGEQLETWCNQEYLSYANSGFNDCTWEKDNKLVADEDDLGKGTKADYIFRVYSSSDYIKENELTSVCMDMKNENPMSKSKKKNADYYKKLDSDRTKKECEYALLVSELEMDGMNDTPILKVREYPNMYMVRPQYFISFLTVIEALSKKYKGLLIEKNKEALKFKDSTEILEEFNSIKDTYIDKPIESMNKKIQTILDNTSKIEKANNDIKASANDIIVNTLMTMKDKIDKLDIKMNSLTKKIDKVQK